MVDTMRKTMHSKLPVSPGMYDSSYKIDHRWHEEYKARNKEKMQIADAQLKAKDFAVPWEKKMTSYSNSVDWQKREGLKASSCVDDAGGRKPEGSCSGPEALQQRKHATSVLPAIENDPPKYYTATKLAATQAEKSEKPQTLAELENKPSYCPCPPAVTQTSGTAGSLLHRQKTVPNWVAYQQFVQKVCKATKHDAQQNRNKMLGSSVLVEECFDLNWKSTYKRDFQHCPGPCDEHCKPNKNLSHVFPEDDPLNQNDWVSEYEDSYSICLSKRNQLASAGLRFGLPLGKGF